MPIVLTFRAADRHLAKRNPLLEKVEKEGWTRRPANIAGGILVKGADGVVILEQLFGTDHPGASRHPSFSRRGLRLWTLPLGLLLS